MTTKKNNPKSIIQPKEYDEQLEVEKMFVAFKEKYKCLQPFFTKREEMIITTAFKFALKHAEQRYKRYLEHIGAVGEFVIVKEEGKTSKEVLFDLVEWEKFKTDKVTLKTEM